MVKAVFAIRKAIMTVFIDLIKKTKMLHARLLDNFKTECREK